MSVETIYHLSYQSSFSSPRHLALSYAAFAALLHSSPDKLLVYHNHGKNDYVRPDWKFRAAGVVHLEGHHSTGVDITLLLPEVAARFESADTPKVYSTIIEPRSPEFEKWTEGSKAWLASKGYTDPLPYIPVTGENGQFVTPSSYAAKAWTSIIEAAGWGIIEHITKTFNAETVRFIAASMFNEVNALDAGLVKEFFEVRGVTVQETQWWTENASGKHLCKVASSLFLALCNSKGKAVYCVPAEKEPFKKATGQVMYLDSAGQEIQPAVWYGQSYLAKPGKEF